MKKTKAAVANGASKNAADSRSQRYEELRTILEDRRREIQSEVQSRMKDVRADTGQAGVVDDVETSESDIQDEIEFALIQMKAETLHRINEALERLEEGTYGRCFECGEEIEPASPAGAAVRRPLQGLRGSARSRSPARAGPLPPDRLQPRSCRTDLAGRIGSITPPGRVPPAIICRLRVLRGAGVSLFCVRTRLSGPIVRCRLHLGSSGYACGGPVRLRTPRVHLPTGASL